MAYLSSYSVQKALYPSLYPIFIHFEPPSICRLLSHPLCHRLFSLHRANDCDCSPPCSRRRCLRRNVNIQRQDALQMLHVHYIYIYILDMYIYICSLSRYVHAYLICLSLSLSLSIAFSRVQLSYLICIYFSLLAIALLCLFLISMNVW